MAKTGNYGFSSLNQNLNSSFTNTSNSDNSKGRVVAARVMSIVLDETHPRFKELGEWNALGAIEFNLVDNPNYNNQTYPVAYPLNPNTKSYPLLNEIVTILTSFSAKTLTETNSLNNPKTKTYYINNVGIWNHPHHNAFSFKDDIPSSQKKSYSQVQVGSISNVSSDSIKIDLGKTFKERSNIHPLLPFEGDIIYEGRWGNSIRLGSTVNGLNPWSEIGSNGDPITIIRNGQGEQTNQGWIPITENINSDDSSIYLTSTQNIPILAASTDYTSYSKDKAPTSPREYNGAQIILDSGRLVFNSWKDHILFSSAKSINLNSQESINIDTKKFITQADKIFLGKEELATEPLMLGNTTVQLLRDLVSSVQELASILKTLESAPVSSNQPATFPKLIVPTSKILNTLKSLENQLGTNPENCTLISQRNYTL